MGKFVEGLTSAIPIVGPAIAGAISSGQERRNVKDTIRHQKEMQEYQWSKDLEMWNLQNEYNTPSQQMQRFKDAGLNPNLIYGKGTAGNATQLPKFQAARPDYTGRSSIAAGALNALSLYQDVRKKDAEIDNVKSLTRLTDEKTATETFNALLRNSQGLLTKQKQEVHAHLARYASEFARLQLKQQQIMVNKMLADVAKSKAQTTKLGVDTGIKRKELQWLIDDNIRPQDPFFLRMLSGPKNKQGSDAFFKDIETFRQKIRKFFGLTGDYGIN